MPSIYGLSVHTVRGQERLTRFIARLAFMEKVCCDLVELKHYVNEQLTHAAGKAASALALPTNLVRQEDAVGIQASVESTNGGTFSTESNGFPFMLGPRQCGATCCWACR
jgi:hypothetical protein